MDHFPDRYLTERAGADGYDDDVDGNGDGDGDVESFYGMGLLPR